MTHCLLLLAVCFPTGDILAATNLARNPDFEVDADRDGIPDEWKSSGDSRLVAQNLSLDEGRTGARCARLECTRFQPGNPAAHAMLCQMGVPVQRGKNYRLSFWAKGRKIAGDLVSIALSDTSEWQNCGLEGNFLPMPDWSRYEFVFTARRDCGSASRLQIWFTSTGTLWVDDLCFEEAGPDLHRPGHVVAAVGKNLVPNASFECGADGWGSAEADRPSHWGGPMNRLFGELDTTQARHGQASLRISLSGDHRPVSYFDYYDLTRQPVLAPLAANIGFLEVAPGEPHTLSVFLKADRAATPAVLAVREFMGRSHAKPLHLSAEWQRYEFTFTPSRRWCYILAGPDLRKTQANPEPPLAATVWIDAVQLEQGRSATDFVPRLPLEFGVATEKTGNVFSWDEPLVFRIAAANASAERRSSNVQLHLVDFFGKQVWRNTVDVPVPAGSAVQTQVKVGPESLLRGSFELHASMTAGDVVQQQSLRLAAIPVYRADDSRFGVNHAYPWPHLLDLTRMAGMIWIRDWSMKWQEVEPENGRFTFAETDHQINRPLEHGLRVLGLLPFPSSNWSSSAPASVESTNRYPANRARAAYAPREQSEFQEYVAQTVSHYRDRIRWWQVFNEPLFTSYSLPRKHGYTGKDYARWTKAFAQAARRENPDCRVLAGIGYLREGETMEDFEQFFAAGGLDACDAIDIHHYPRIRPPEFIEAPLARLGSQMEKHGGRKPIWLTEYGYYADDQPWAVPIANSGFDSPLPSEQVQSEYAVRWTTMMLAGGVEKVFYHAGTCDGINSDSLQGIFYEYAGTPHKIYAVQAVMANLFTPATNFVKRLSLNGGARGYVFHSDERAIAVLWSTADATPEPIRLTDERVRLWDIVGRPQPARELTPSETPIYLVAEGTTAEVFDGLEAN